MPACQDPLLSLQNEYSRRVGGDGKTSPPSGENIEELPADFFDGQWPYDADDFIEASGNESMPCRSSQNKAVRCDHLAVDIRPRKIRRCAEYYDSSESEEDGEDRARNPEARKFGTNTAPEKPGKPKPIYDSELMHALNSSDIPRRNPGGRNLAPVRGSENATIRNAASTGRHDENQPNEMKSHLRKISLRPPLPQVIHPVMRIPLHPVSQTQSGPLRSEVDQPDMGNSNSEGRRTLPPKLPLSSATGELACDPEGQVRESATKITESDTQTEQQIAMSGSSLSRANKNGRPLTKDQAQLAMSAMPRIGGDQRCDVPRRGRRARHGRGRAPRHRGNQKQSDAVWLGGSHRPSSNGAAQTDGEEKTRRCRPGSPFEGANDFKNGNGNRDQGCNRFKRSRNISFGVPVSEQIPLVEDGIEELSGPVPSRFSQSLPANQVQPSSTSQQLWSPGQCVSEGTGLQPVIPPVPPLPLAAPPFGVSHIGSTSAHPPACEASEPSPTCIPQSLSAASEIPRPGAVEDLRAVIEHRKSLRRNCSPSRKGPSSSLGPRKERSNSYEVKDPGLSRAFKSSKPNSHKRNCGRRGRQRTTAGSGAHDGNPTGRRRKKRRYSERN